MLNEFAGIRKVSDKSLGRDETPRHTSHEILILHMYLTIFFTIYEDHRFVSAASDHFFFLF